MRKPLYIHIVTALAAASIAALPQSAFNRALRALTVALMVGAGGTAASKIAQSSVHKEILQRNGEIGQLRQEQQRWQQVVRDLSQQVQEKEQELQNRQMELAELQAQLQQSSKQAQDLGKLNWPSNSACTKSSASGSKESRSSAGKSRKARKNFLGCRGRFDKKASSSKTEIGKCKASEQRLRN